jgi:hypothetical protein
MASARQERRLHVLVWGTAATIAAALVFLVTWLATDAALHRPGGVRDADTAVTRTTAREPGGDRTSARSLPVDGAAVDATEVPGAADENWIVEVQDTAGRPVDRAVVTVADARGSSLARDPVSGEGLLLLTRGVHPAAGCTMTASVPGRSLRQPFVPSSRPFRAVLNVGDMGTLRIMCEGSGADLEVGEAQDGGVLDPFEVGDGNGSVEVRVAAGGVPYVVKARTPCFVVSERVVGPRAQGEVVDVRLDLRSCLVTGRLLGGDILDLPIHAQWFAAGVAHGFRVAVGERGEFALELPRGRPMQLTFTRDVEFASCDLPALHADHHEVGGVVFLPRPRLGVLELRDPDGKLWLAAPQIVRVLMEDGSQGPDSWIRFIGSARLGIEVLGAPGVASVVVAPSAPECFCEPAFLTIHGGGAFRAQFMTGCRVIVRLVEPGATGLRRLRLQNTATKQVHPAGGRLIDAGTGTQEYTFDDVRPGHCEVTAEDVELVGGKLVVGPSREQQFEVAIRPR